MIDGGIIIKSGIDKGPSLAEMWPVYAVCGTMIALGVGGVVAEVYKTAREIHEKGFRAYLDGM